MKIAVDKNQFSGSHGKSNARKHRQLAELGHELIQVPLPFSDYCPITDQMQETIDRRGAKLKKQDLVGDIKVCVDTKKDLLEVCGNICSGSHGRFRDEIILAQKVGAKMYILVEEPGIESIRDVFKWQNPRLHRYNKIRYMHEIGKWRDIPEPKSPPTPGSTLAKAMITHEEKYDCIFLFCRPEESAAKIEELLTGGE